MFPELAFDMELTSCSVVREIIAKRPQTVFDEDEDGNTPLHLACINGYQGVGKVLIGANVDIEAR